MPQLIVFLIGSCGLIYLTVRLRSRHGIPRLIAFEAILGLVVLNVPHWLDDPWSWLHLLSWALLIASAFLAVHGFYLLRQIGKPQGQFEQTTELVTVGAYKYIRHPLYASLLYLGLGSGLKNITWLTGILVLVVCAALYATARVEETENRQHFGPAYEAYMQKTRMFIPFLF
jgi:protein-S-isoprenylcysteine O-methyltransferase Ste14